jgi:hypothetical protein
VVTAELAVGVVMGSLFRCVVKRCGSVAR